MIDWLTVRVYGVDDPRICGGWVYSFDRDGSPEWKIEKRRQVKGSWSSSVSVRRRPHDSTVEISGNPAKWFQGHNVFGAGDLVLLAREFVRSVLRAAGVVVSSEAAALLDQGVVVLSRVDVTESWDFGTRHRAISAVQAISEAGHLKHRGRGSLLAEGTCYFGKGSRRMSGKAYSKGLELLKHRPSSELPLRDRLLDVADGLVRFEFTLRSMWLKDRRLDVLRNWGTKGVTPAGLHAELMTGLNLSDATMRDTKAIEGLPPRLQAVYQAWFNGADVRSFLKRATFYRYRAALLPFDVDIAVRRPSSNVVRLRPVLEGIPFQVPDWAKGTPLYFEPLAA